MDKIKYIVPILLMIIISLLSILVVEGETAMDKYGWLPSESAFKNYPMHMVSGSFMLNDGASVDIPSRDVMQNGWGEVGSIYLVGDKIKPLPKRMEISYFSFTEDKFYGGAFDLPYAKIHNLFQRGIESPKTGKMVTYQKVIVGLAPEGRISLWLLAEGEVLEVATFQAAEKIIDWKVVLDNDHISRKAYIEKVLKRTLSDDQISELNKRGLPRNIIESYGKQYPWNLEIVGCRFLNLWLKTHNGECEFFNPKGPRSNRTNRAVPKTLDIEWQNKMGIKYIANILFDEYESFLVYKKMSALNNELSLKLLIEISDKTNSIEIFVTDSKHIVKLEKIKVKVFRL
jgi:hypothetical protein